MEKQTEKSNWVSWGGKMEDALAKQVDGSHYLNYSIQPVEFIVKNGLDFIEGCIVKYICRYKVKGGRKDLEKIKHYIDLLIRFKYPDYPLTGPQHEILIAKSDR